MGDGGSAAVQTGLAVEFDFKFLLEFVGGQIEGFRDENIFVKI
jgi:hypothetical protein